MSVYLSWIEESPPKRSAVGSNPITDATKKYEDYNSDVVVFFNFSKQNVHLTSKKCKKIYFSKSLIYNYDESKG